MIQSERTRKALKLLKLRPIDFPLEITVSSGETFRLSRSNSLDLRPDGGIVLFPENSFLEYVIPEQVVTIKRASFFRRWADNLLGRSS